MDEGLRNQIFNEDLGELLRGEYITKEEYDKVNFKYSIYCKNKKILMQKELIKETIKTYPKIKPEVPPVRNIPRQEPIRVKKEMSSQAIRDRNITLVLILGVILVLMSGIVLATSNWKVLPNSLKTILIVLVSVMFFGMSILTDKALKIEKTAFAFWVLGSFFLPVAILSAGFFKLFGGWLSVTGEGRYVLGVIGALVCIPIYLYSAARNKNRFFVWISYITITLGIYNLVAAFKFNIDIFFFLIIIYDSIVMLSYAKLKSLDKYKLFTKELFNFSQVNLIISTILIFTIYHNFQFYGINIILLSILYIVMVYLENKEGYIYVFSGLITYGIYQIIEHSNTGFLELLLLSAIGIIFIGMEKYKNTEDKLKVIYRYLNGLVTTFTFIYITIKGIMISQSYPTSILVIAYLIISVNFIYLSYTSNKKIFNYLAPIFLAVTGVQLCRLIQSLFTVNIATISIFSISLLLFFLIYYRNYSKYLNNIRNSTGVVSCVLIGISVIFSFYDKQWILSTFILYFASYLAYLINSNCTNKYVITITKWSMPLNILFGTCVLFGGINKIFMNSWYDLSYHIGVSVLMLLLLSFFLNKINKLIGNAFFIVAHIFMPLSILVLMVSHHDKPIIFIVESLIYLCNAFIANKESRKKIFIYAGLVTNAITLACIYTNSNHSTIMLLITYLIISVNFICLSYTSNKKLFNYLAPIFLAVTGLQLYRIIQDLVTLNITAISIFSISLLLFFFIYHRNYSKYLNNIRNSSGVVSCVLIGISVIFSFYDKQWFLSTLILYFSSYLVYLINSSCTNKYVITITKWNMPFNILLGTCSLFGEINKIFINSWYDLPYHIGVSVLGLFLLSFCFKKVSSKLDRPFFLVAHIFMSVSMLVLLVAHFKNPIIFIIAALVYLYSALAENKEVLKRIFLYVGLMTSSLILPSILVLLKLDVEGLKYVMLVMTVLMAVLWWFSKVEWRNRITPFILIYSAIGSLIFNISALLEVKNFFLALIYVAIILFIMHKEKLDHLIILPLLLLLHAIRILDNPILYNSNIWRMIILVGVAITLRIIGQLLYKSIYEKASDKLGEKGHVDLYSITSFLVLITTFFNNYGTSAKWVQFIVLALISGLTYSQINRVEMGKARKIAITVSMLSTILPYYKLMNNLQVPSIIATELKLLPWIVIVTILYKKIWKDSDREIETISLINSIVIVLSALILLQGVAANNFLMDRLILGVLSLLAIFIGMQYRVKIYFFTGIIALLVNILIQTKELWLNIPWWGYLLISGLILIGMASLNEVQKNKDKKEKKTIKDRLKDWN